MSDETRLWESASKKEPRTDATASELQADFLDKEDPQHYEEPYVLPPLRPHRHYMAFRLGKRRERLRIDRAVKPMRFPSYHYLEDISFDQEQQLGFHLFFNNMTVTVRGKYLWPVVHAISSGRCEAIHEYHAKVYDPPAKGEPVIESIAITPPATLADDD